MIRLIIFIASQLAAIAAMNHFFPGPGDADIRGHATIVK